MKKRIIYILIAFCIGAAPVSAQILKGTWILNPQLSAFNLGSSLTQETGKRTFDLGIHFDGGKFIAKNLVILAGVGGNFAWNKEYADNKFDLQAGVRYYPIGGLFAEINLGYTHSWQKAVNAIDYTRRDYLFVGADLGYAFFVCQNVSIDPAIYWKYSFIDRYNKYGLRLGFSIYL